MACLYWYQKKDRRGNRDRTYFCILRSMSWTSRPVEEILTGGRRVRRLCRRVGVEGVEVVEEAVEEAPSKKPPKEFDAEAEAAARVSTPTPPIPLMEMPLVTQPPLPCNIAPPCGGRGGRKCSWRWWRLAGEWLSHRLIWLLLDSPNPAGTTWKCKKTIVYEE